jgi:hypothetical protein
MAVKLTARCYTGWAIPTMYPTFTSPHWYTFLTLFLNTWVLTREVPIAPWGNRFQSAMVLFIKEISQHLFLFSWTLFSNSDQLFRSMAPVNSPLYLSTPFHRYTLCRAHTSLLSCAEPRVPRLGLPYDGICLVWKGCLQICHFPVIFDVALYRVGAYTVYVLWDLHVYSW